MLSELKRTFLVKKELQPLEFHAREIKLGEPTHVTVDWILLLMYKTADILQLYNVTIHTYSEYLYQKCMAELLENINAEYDPSDKPLISNNLYYGATVNCQRNMVSSEWQKLLYTKDKSLAFIIACILNYKEEVEIEKRIDWDTGEHLLAIYNSLFYHITLYPPASDSEFNLLIKNVCIIVHMCCIQYLNFYPEHREHILLCL